MAEVDVEKIMRDVRARATRRRSLRVRVSGALTGGDPTTAHPEAMTHTRSLIASARERAKRIAWLRRRVQAMKRLARGETSWRSPWRSSSAPGAQERRGAGRIRGAVMRIVTAPLRGFVWLRVSWALMRHQADLNLDLLMALDDLSERLEHCERALELQSEKNDTPGAQEEKSGNG